MAIRTEMQTLIVHVQRLVSDAGATTWGTTEVVQDALDAHATLFDYLPLWHDSDYRRYAATQRSETARQAADANTSQLSAVIYDVPDFGMFYKVGYIASDWVIRSSPDEATAAQSPDVVDAIGVTFLFSTVPNQELYLKATGYNVWKAARDLLLETPDSGREIDTARVRGQVSRTIKPKFDFYATRGRLLNRRHRHYSRV